MVTSNSELTYCVREHHVTKYLVVEEFEVISFQQDGINGLTNIYNFMKNCSVWIYAGKHLVMAKSQRAQLIVYATSSLLVVHKLYNAAQLF